MARASLRDLLLLTRAPLALTAVADGLSGYLLATVHVARDVAPGDHPDALVHDHAWARELALVGAASAALYLAGMALNDYFDRERDRQRASGRPIPSGRVGPGLALALGLSLLAAGVGASFFAGGEPATLAAGAVALFVVAYDGLLKRWRLPGAVGMGLCRGANVLMGALAGGLLGEGATTLPHKLALASFTYVFSLTLLSTFEDEDAPAPGVLLGFGGALAAPVALLAALPPGGRELASAFTAGHAVLVLLLAARALRKGTRATGHETTRWLIRSLFLLDGAALAGSGLLDAKVAAILGTLFVVYVGGAKLLFRPPRAATPPSAPAAVPDAGQL